MSQLVKIIWRFGGCLNKYDVSKQQGVYIHVLRGRIIYVGKGFIEQRQGAHYYKYKKLDCFFYNLPKIDELEISDLYTLICNGKYSDNLTNRLLYDQNNCKNVEGIDSIVKMNLHQTSIYYHLTNDEELSLKLEEALQVFLIRKYNMDSYDNGKYPIGKVSEESKMFDPDLLIEHDFKEILF